MGASKVDTVVHGGTVVTPTHTFEGGVAIKGEKIVAVGPDDMLPDADNYIDATGKQVFPGAIDASFGRNRFITCGCIWSLANITSPPAIIGELAEP